MDKKYIIIGDLHGKYKSLLKILNEYGIEYSEEKKKWESVKGYYLISLGDLCDYTSDIENKSSLKCIEIFMELYRDKIANAIMSNHQDKLYRWMYGKNVQLTNGLDNTVNEIYEAKLRNTQKWYDIWQWLTERHLYLKLDIKKDGKNVIVAHAYIDEKMWQYLLYPYSNNTKREIDWFKSCCIYGLTNSDGRISWWDEEDSNKRFETIFPIVGHYHLTKKSDNYIILDTDDNTVAVYDFDVDEIKFYENED